MACFTIREKVYLLRFGSGVAPICRIIDEGCLTRRHTTCLPPADHSPPICYPPLLQEVSFGIQKGQFLKKKVFPSELKHRQNFGPQKLAQETHFILCSKTVYQHGTAHIGINCFCINSRKINTNGTNLIKSTNILHVFATLVEDCLG